MLCVRAWTVRVSVGLVWLVSLVFHYWVEKNAVCVSFLLVFGLPLTATIASISLDASPFHQIGWAEPYCKNAFVRFDLLMLWYSITLSAKEATQSRVSLRNTLRANPTKDFGKNET